MLGYDFDWFVIFTALNASLLLWLGLNVSKLRITKKLPYGDGGDKDMAQAIRAHANGVEHVSLFAVLVLALCFTKASNTLLAAVVIIFTLGRVLHAIGMLKRTFNARRLGAGITFGLEAIAIVALFISILS